MRKIISTLLALTFAVSMLATAAFAAETSKVVSVTRVSELQPGEYEPAAALTCFMNAMGGCNLSANLLETASLVVDENGTAALTLNFPETAAWSHAYGSATTYVETTGNIGYYDGSQWLDADYTTATSSDGTYEYVSAMTFPVTEVAETYSLAMSLSGYQFGGDTAHVLSNGSVMEAVLSVDWSKVTVCSSVESNESAADNATPTIPESEVTTAESTLDATLSCYMNAMGGCELAENLVKSVIHVENEDGTMTITLIFHEKAVWSHAYGGSTTYVEATGDIGYYDGTQWVDAVYTTAASSDGSYEYVSSMTFIVPSDAQTCDLAMFLSGYQFGGENAHVLSNGSAMKAVLTLATNKDETEVMPEETVTPDINEESTPEVSPTPEISPTPEPEVTEEPKSTVTSVSELKNLSAGKYRLTSSFSCYMSAMGGCDFGTNLLKYAVLDVAQDGTAEITLYFYENVDVTMMYGVASAHAEEGETAYYNGSAWVSADYTTAKSSDGSYEYISSMTFPISDVSNTYDLALNVGGTQFGGESARMISDGSVLKAVLTVDWSNVYGNPKTGDNSNVILWTALMVMSMGVFVCLTVKKRKAN